MIQTYKVGSDGRPMLAGAFIRRFHLQEDAELFAGMVKRLWLAEATDISEIRIVPEGIHIVIVVREDDETNGQSELQRLVKLAVEP